MVLDKLTEEQEILLTEFRAEYLQVGLSTKPIDRNDSIDIIAELYKNYLDLKAPEVWFVDSPLQAQLVINLLKNNLGVNIDNNIWNNLGKKLVANLGDNLWDNLWANLGANLWANLWANLRANLRDNLGDNLRANLWDNLGDNLWDNLWDNLGDEYIGIYLWGSLETFWVAFYLFPLKIGIIDYGNKLNAELLLFERYIRNCGVIYTFENICFVCENPLEINKKDVVLHADNKPAVLYKDGYAIYVLNGINVPKWLVMTPSNELTLKQYHSIENADVRTEFIRKFGTERMIGLGKIVDSYENYRDNKFWVKSQYKLIDMASVFTGIDYAPHLYMLNQTVKGVYHLEPVSPSCLNLQQALDEREQLDSSKYNTIWIK